MVEEDGVYVILVGLVVEMGSKIVMIAGWWLVMFNVQCWILWL